MEISTAFPPVLEAIISRIASGLGPERIYLFGSHASGKAGQGSDYDLLVVVPHSNLPRHRREAQCYDLLWGLSTPVDVIVLTRTEFKSLSRVKTSLASTAKTKGILLYDRSKAG